MNMFYYVLTYEVGQTFYFPETRVCETTVIFALRRISFILLARSWRQSQSNVHNSYQDT
jgi:hypothetical protein